MPQAILLQDVEGLGDKGGVVDVSAGYLRNFLVPRKLAQPATKGSLDAARKQMEAAERAQREATERAEENGRLFGSVTTQDIVDAIRDARGIKVDRRKVHLPDPIRHVGTHMVVVEVNEGVTATVKTMVVEQK
jgi:large subunit ribosomal protein L9